MDVSNPCQRGRLISRKYLCWEEVATNFIALLAARPPEKYWKKLFLGMLRLEVRAGRKNSKVKVYLLATIGDLIGTYIRSVRRDLDATKLRPDGEFLRIYCDEWIAFIKTMEFLTEVQENLGSPLVGCKLVRACIDFWTDEIIMPDDSAVLPKIMRVFSRKIFEDKDDRKKREQVDKIIGSFKTMHYSSRSRVFEKIQTLYTEYMINESFKDYVLDSLASTTCRKTLNKIKQWKQDLAMLGRRLLLAFPTSPFVEKILVENFSQRILGKAADEVSVLYETFLKTGKANDLMPLTSLAKKDTLGLLWSAEYLATHGFPAELRCMRKNFKNFSALCGLRGSELLDVWMQEARVRVRDKIMTFPTDRASQLTDSKAYCDFYIDSWTSFCKYVFFHDVLLSRIDPELDVFVFFLMCFSDWAELILNVQRKRLYYHLVVMFRKYYSDPTIELQLKLQAIVNSFRIIDSEDYYRFQAYYARKVMLPYSEEITAKLLGKLTLENCVSEIKRVTSQVTTSCIQMGFYKRVIGDFNERVMALYFDLLSRVIEGHLFEGNVDVINDACGLIDRDDTQKGREFLAKIHIMCRMKGRREIRSHLQEDVKSPYSLPRALMKATSGFRSFVASIRSRELRKAIAEGFRFAVDEAAKETHYEAYMILIEHTLPSSLLREPDGLGGFASDEAREKEILQTFNFVPKVEGFSKLYARSFVSGVLKGTRSGAIEHRLFRNVCEFLGRSYALQLEHQLFDVLLSERRMLVLPTAYGFERTKPETDSGESATDEEKTLEALEELKSWKKSLDLKKKYLTDEDSESRETVSFQGVELNIRVLRDKLWPISPMNITFSAPPLLHEIMHSFGKIYKMESYGRKLTWILELSTVEMQCRFTPDRRVYEVKCTTPVAAVLLLFEHNDVHTYESIQEQTKMSPDYLRACIDKLLDDTILVKKGGDPKETIGLNLDFVSPKPDIQLHVIYEDKSDDGRNQKLLAKVKCETKYEERMRSVTCAQAAIVRVAKRALRISKKELVQRAIWELGSRASPDPSVIISALESLVDKDYLDYDGKTGIITYVL